jgi:hypothetical protein
MFKLIGKWGMRLLGVWLILQGLIPLLELNFRYQQQLLLVLAVVAGVLVLLDR